MKPLTTDKRIFFEALHLARQFKVSMPRTWHSFMRGYLKALKNHKEDLEIAEKIKSWWKHQRSGAD